MERRRLLRVGGASMAGALAGCPALSNGRPDVNPATGLGEDASAALEGTPVFLAGDTGALPTPPETADSLAAAEVALATPDAASAPLVDALASGTTVAFAGDGAPPALSALLAAAGDEYHYGTETVEGASVEPAVAVPRGDAVDTFQFVREGGWGDSVLDPLGWALAGRMPECSTFVPEGTGDDSSERLGSAWIAGRLPTGETYAARTTASRDTRNPDLRRIGLRTTLHAAASDGYDVASVRRVADVANGREVADWFPNPHTRSGIEVSNRSGPVEERLEVSLAPASDRARAALTGCCGMTIRDAVAYDHDTRWTWTDDRLLGSDSRYGGGLGRGEWHVAE